MNIYKLTINNITIEGITAKSYGIKCSPQNTAPVQITDISTDRDKVERLVEIMNRLEVSPVHFEDIIEDEL